MSEAAAPDGQPSEGTTGDSPRANNNDEAKVNRQRGNRRNRQRTNKKREGHIHVPKEKFLGRSEDLQGYTYDVMTSKGGVAYTRTTEELARHVGEKSTAIGSHVRAAILTLNLTALPRPTAPTATGDPAIDTVEAEIFKEKVRMYVKNEAGIAVAMKSLYDLIWGQCTDSLRSRLRGDDNFATYSTNADSLALLRAIRSEMTGFRNKKYLPHALHQIVRDFYNLTQGKHHSNQEYYDEFNALVFTAEESGAVIGVHTASINELLQTVAADPTNPSDAENLEAVKLARERYFAVAFLLGADRTRYVPTFEFASRLRRYSFSISSIRVPYRVRSAPNRKATAK